MLNFMIKSIVLTVLLFSSLTNYDSLHEFSIGICIYLLTKWWTDYRHCTFSYIECKWIRKVDKKQGYLYNFLEPIFDINRYPHKNLIYVIFLCIFIINWIQFFNPHPLPVCLF